MALGHIQDEVGLFSIQGRPQWDHTALWQAEVSSGQLLILHRDKPGEMRPWPRERATGGPAGVGDLAITRNTPCSRDGMWELTFFIHADLGGSRISKSPL